MDSLQNQKKPLTLKPGLVNFPGATPASTALVVELLRKDVAEHHCYFNDDHFHNHLSHQILSLHDLGASAECIQAMYDKAAAIQRPLHPNGTPAESNRITEKNWTSHMGEENAHMYPDYVTFFASEIAKHGVPSVLERYLFSPEANGNGTFMLARFMSGLVHPIIDTAFGIEFDQSFLIAPGLAMAAVTFPEGAVLMDMPSGLPEIKSGPPTTLLSLLREVYESPKLTPMPYDEGRVAFKPLMDRMASNPDRAAAIREIYAKWVFDFTDAEDFSKKVDECMWQAALLLGATSKAGRKPRMDFFIMHFLTSALSVRVVLDALKQPLHKAQLLQAYARTAAMFAFLRGRPCIDPALVMSYTACPAPPKTASASGLGRLGYGSPWLAILNNAAVHPEPHVVKAIRSLFYCAQHYGEETHKGAAMMDGTLFIRVAGVLMDAITAFRPPHRHRSARS
ncbi:hypothetical protein B0H13DRAFT_1612389 [Mycena leptocephala]|nr:hypothetical protein B0H13DRAFT_1612389 [Mycena leptocephala]